MVVFLWMWKRNSFVTRSKMSIHVCCAAGVDDEWVCTTTIFRFSTTITKLNKISLDHQQSTHTRTRMCNTFQRNSKTSAETNGARLQCADSDNDKNGWRWEARKCGIHIGGVVLHANDRKKCTRNISIRAVIKYFRCTMHMHIFETRSILCFRYAIIIRRFHNFHFISQCQLQNE